MNMIQKLRVLIINEWGVKDITYLKDIATYFDDCSQAKELHLCATVVFDFPVHLFTLATAEPMGEQAVFDDDVDLFRLATAE